uniref:Uncharacterized protein n=1 Tax=Timema genevievae TaxID=629358 RepID=A0A7R9PIR6_TIMGE|nr:unnamed protein product [Timema genevievae]
MRQDRYKRELRWLVRGVRFESRPVELGGMKEGGGGGGFTLAVSGGQGSNPSQETPSPLPSSPERELNLNLPVIGSIAQHESSVLSNYATEAAYKNPRLSRKFIKTPLSIRPLPLPDERGERGLPQEAALQHGGEDGHLVVERPPETSAVVQM